MRRKLDEKARKRGDCPAPMCGGKNLVANTTLLKEGGRWGPNPRKLKLSRGALQGKSRAGRNFRFQGEGTGDLFLQSLGIAL